MAFFKDSFRFKGFTLIEVLITITIIGIVFGVVAISSTSIQANSRDSQRQTDLRTIQGALQQFYADQHFYPTSTQLVFGSPLSSGTRTYMDKVPVDPTSGTITPYCYVAQNTRTVTTCDNAPTATNHCHYYELYANLENNSAGGFTCSSQTYDIRVNPL